MSRMILGAVGQKVNMAPSNYKEDGNLVFRGTKGNRKHRIVNIKLTSACLDFMA